MWLAVEGMDGSTRLRRVMWAAAEAGRRGRLVLVEPVGEVAWPGLRKAHARALAVEEGAARLRAAGIGRAARLAAVLELSPEAIEDAAKLAGAGVAEGELEGVALREEDPGAALARLVEERGLARAEPCGRFRLPDWPERIEMALEAGDPETAAHWAAAWRAATGGDARSTAALARVRVFEGALPEARALLEEARRRAAGGSDESSRFELLRAEGHVLMADGFEAKAIQRLKEAIGLARGLGRSMYERGELHDAWVRALSRSGRLDEAERALDTWTETLRAQGSRRYDPLIARAAATLMLARGDTPGATQVLEQTLARWPDRDHPGIGPLEQILAQVWIEQRRYREAERLMRAAIERFGRRGHRTTHLRHEHARALFGMGRFREAEEELRRALEEMTSSGQAVVTRHELARCVAAQGRLDEAEELLDACMGELRQRGAVELPAFATSLYEKGHIRRLRGDFAGAADLLQEVLRIEERTLGREHPTLIPTLAELGGTLTDFGQPREAEPLLRRALRLAEEAGDIPGLAAALGELARAQAAQGFHHARDTARRALGTLVNTESPLSPALRGELEVIAAGATRPSTPSRRRG
jgi:tetratricopeptide (TPR) repeat protein